MAVSLPMPTWSHFYKWSDLKRYFVPLLKYFSIKPVCTTVKNLQANAPVERVHQVIYNMLVTKDLNNKVFDYIEPWGKILESITWVIRGYYNCTINTTPLQAVFGWDTKLNFAPIVDWRVITARNQQQFSIDHDWKTPHESDISLK